MHWLAAVNTGLNTLLVSDLYFLIVEEAPQGYKNCDIKTKELKTILYHGSFNGAFPIFLHG